MAETIVVASNNHSPNDHESKDAPGHPKDDVPDRPPSAKRGRVKDAASELVVVRPKRHRKKPETEPRVSKEAAKEEEAEVTYAALQRTFAEHLAMVRAEFREAVANYSVRVQGLLTHIDDSVADGSSPLTGEDRERRRRAIQDALKAIESLNLKPSKGRRRDLKKVETLAEHLGDIIDEW